jgi:very-short-patch-repair endonuclease
MQPTKQRAREQRKELTPPEFKLWLRLRERAPDRPAFRSQHPMGPYILDFYCRKAKLCVEVDGWSHNMGDRPERDVRRDAWLVEQGVTVLRIPAADVLKDPDGVAEMIVATAIRRCG